ncbi:DNA repair protein RAD16 [Stygiomarasmius scandens]|uniref:DNA repair protein RAD16 n=1 Tax=Marasmiellus scandens TaxID=2682957 RepID=A0ABR1J2R9_9AGAR
MSTLLPFHSSILNEIHDPATSDLLILARGLGLRRIICTLLKIYDSPQNLILLVNATQEEETEIGEELGIMGCRKPGLRVVGYETGSRDRQDLYKKGGLISVTSRILVVDMLQNDIPIDLITGIMVLHAEKISPLHLVSFITRLYRDKNKTGFLKAFTDQPEHITSGLQPLKSVMKELQLRRVHIYPRFHQDIKDALERRRADVVELSQDMTQAMDDIHGAIVQCMNSTLAELRRSKDLDLDGLSLPAAYFSSFDHIVRKQLDPVWHKVGGTTKALVRDLGVLRRLVGYLLTYDPLQFHTYCQSLIAANNEASSSKSSDSSAGKSQWMFTDAANIIFEQAKFRCFMTITPSNKGKTPKPSEVIDLVDIDDDEEGWNALYELEGRAPLPAPNRNQTSKPDKRPPWLPETMQPVLEELPKWSLFAEILEEIEGEILKMENDALAGRGKGKDRFELGTNTTLVMCSSNATCTLLTEYLDKMDNKRRKGEWGRRMMLRKLKSWLWWEQKKKWLMEKGGTAGVAAVTTFNEMMLRGAGALEGGGDDDGADEGLSEALKKKDREKIQKQASRRRVRGAAPVGAVGGRGSTVPPPAQPVASGSNDVPVAARPMEEFFTDADMELLSMDDDEIQLNFGGTAPTADITTLGFATEFDTHYGLLQPAQTVLVRAYSDDSDDRILDELKPRFIVMFEPCMEFVRRVEVYKCSNPGLAVRVYHMVYSNSCEEHKYLAGIRREKDSFERLIKERGSMLLPIYEDHQRTESDAIIKTISSRIAGGRRELNTAPSQVIVDMREFRSTLPSLLHAANLLVIPATLTVGDYILTPEICVERKSLADLVSSFNSGRLYTQCELMSVHYKTPVLLIEFEEDKAFSLEIVSDLKSYAKANPRYPPKKKPTGPSDPNSSSSSSSPSIQSKIVLLTLSFPRLKIIWSSSPYTTAEIFNDLKKDRPEPSPTTAIAIGAEEDPYAGAGINTAAEELLRSFPGITAKNVKHVMSKVDSVRELCEMDLVGVQGILGAEPGKACWEFLHRGEEGWRKR